MGKRIVIYKNPRPQNADGELGAPDGMRDVHARVRGKANTMPGNLSIEIGNRLRETGWSVVDVRTQHTLWSVLMDHIQDVYVQVYDRHTDEDVRAGLRRDLASVMDVTAVDIVSSTGNTTNPNANHNQTPTGSWNNNPPASTFLGLDLSSLAIGGVSGGVIAGAIFLFILLKK